MRQLLQRLWNDDAGFIFSTELMLVFVILLLGIIAGLTALRNAVNSELVETGQALLSLNQGYTITGTSSCGSGSAFSGASDVQGTLSWGQFSGTSDPIDQSACP